MGGSTVVPLNYITMAHSSDKYKLIHIAVLI